MKKVFSFKKSKHLKGICIAAFHEGFIWFQLICLYPGLLPSNTNFQRSVPSLHEIADVNQLSHGNKDTVLEYKNFLQMYLEDIHGSSDAVGFKQVGIVSGKWQITCLTMVAISHVGKLILFSLLLEQNINLTKSKQLRQKRKVKKLYIN